MQIQYRLYPFGDEAIILYFGPEASRETNYLLNLAAHEIKESGFPGFEEVVCSYNTLTVHYDKSKIDSTNHFMTVGNWIDEIMEQIPDKPAFEQDLIYIPVCYHPLLAPDLIRVSKTNHMSINELIDAHANELYYTSYFSFGNGTPFFGGKNKNIYAPKRSEAHFHFPIGAVGISGSQTGIYPISTTMAWNIIGRAPVSIVNKIVQLARPGSEVKFVPISLDDYYHIENIEQKNKGIS